MNDHGFLSKNAFFTTRNYASQFDIGVDSASRHLKNSELPQVTRGVWANPFHKHYSAYGAIPYLLSNEQGYLSFLSALHRHGMISQIPSTIQIATTGRSRRLVSTIGEFAFFQVAPKLMQEGVEVFDGGLQYNIATPEKALLDTLYIATKKGNRFNQLPEVEFHDFSDKKFRAMLAGYPLKSQRPILERYLKMR